MFVSGLLSFNGQNWPLTTRKVDVPLVFSYMYMSWSAVVSIIMAKSGPVVDLYLGDKICKEILKMTFLQQIYLWIYFFGKWQSVMELGLPKNVFKCTKCGLIKLISIIYLS